jgi:hypothetical protein
LSFENAGVIEKELESVDIDDCCTLVVLSSSTGGRIFLWELTTKEPKYMQVLHCDNKGIPVVSEYISSIKTLFVLFKRENVNPPETKHTLCAFSFDPQNRRLKETTYVFLSFIV